ncbi:MAG: transglycosylase SLT domain-containing protein [Legionellales bacterium]|nr:transglycosylase SLT domain-containing protein [Legionellales bacterium]
MVLTLKKYLFVVILSLFIAGCSRPPQPNNINNVCSIFKQYPRWYWATQKTQKRWGVPIQVQMAIIHQESGFNAKIKPKRTKLLGFIPWKRPSSARGYTQALKQTWREYRQDTGRSSATRTKFKDATDFVGWYGHRVHARAKVSKYDAYRIYLAYHEGIGGYQRRTYVKKPWLVNVANKVQRRATTYEAQLRGCRSKLKKKPFLFFWL